MNERKSAYRKEKVLKILEIKDYAGFEGSEIEDIIPIDILFKALIKTLPRDIDDDFEDSYVENSPIVPQIEKFASDHNVKLTKGWKVELAKKIKPLMLKKEFSKEECKIWKKLFSKFS